MTDDPIDAVMRAAFAAVARGDYAERDRLCDRARIMMAKEARDRTLEKLLRADFLVSPDGTVYVTRDVLREAL